MLTRITSLFISFCFITNTNAQFDWVHTDGPKGAAASPIYSSSDYLFSTDPFFLYRSEDGKNWEKIQEGYFFPIAIHGETVIGQARHNDYYSNESVVLKISFDNGETWTDTNMPNGLISHNMTFCGHGIYISRWQDGIIHRSVDFGTTWDTLIPPMTHGYDVYSFDDRLYIGNSLHLWRTDTDGENWENVTPPLQPQEYIRTMAAEGDNIFVATEVKVWSSNDNGVSWTSFTLGGWPNGFDDIVITEGKVFTLAGTDRVFKSNNLGQTWTELPKPYDGFSSVRLMGWNGNLYFSTYNNGIWYWDDIAGEHVEANDGFNSAAVYNLDFRDDKLWAATGTGVFSMDASSGQWSQESGIPLPFRYYSNVETGSNGLIGVHEWWSQNFMLSTDYGQTWEQKFPYPGPSGFFGAIERFQIVNDVIFACSFSNGCSFSSDNGVTWDHSLGSIMPYSGRLVEYNGLILSYTQDQILASGDAGKTWQPYSIFSPGGLYALFFAEDRFLAVSSNTINGIWGYWLYTSTDGVNWEYANDGLPNNAITFGAFESVEDLYFFKFADTYFLRCNGVGLFASQDYCKTWVPTNVGYHQNTIMGEDGVLYAGSFGGGVFKTEIADIVSVVMSGLVFLDQNHNSVFDTGESPLTHTPVFVKGSLPNTQYSTTTNANGEYFIGVTAGTADTLRPVINTPYLENVTPTYYLTDNPGPDRDFAVNMSQDINDLSINANYFSLPRPGFDYRLLLKVENVGTLPTVATVSLRLDPKLTFLSSSIPPTAVIGDSLVWDLGTINLSGVQSIMVETKVPTTVALNDVVYCTARVHTTFPDQNPGNNVYGLGAIVVGSYDPNDKRVEPSEGLTAQEIADGKELIYTIRFQNTGTYHADRVRITDMLDTALYKPSLRLVMASHTVTSFDLRPGGLLQVIFDDIFLPDSSSNEPKSHGFVTFAIQRNKQFNSLHKVTNTAAIYFDFNEPIFTNEVYFTVPENPLNAVFEEKRSKAVPQLFVFPNPAKSAFTVSSLGRLSGSGYLKIQSAEGIQRYMGVVQDLAKPQYIDVANLPAGIHFIQMEGQTGYMSGKIVVLP